MSEIEALTKDLERLHAQNHALLDEVERYREALEFYADETKYFGTRWREGMISTDPNFNQLALGYLKLQSDLRTLAEAVVDLHDAAVCYAGTPITGMGTKHQAAITLAQGILEIKE